MKANSSFSLAFGAAAMLISSATFANPPLKPAPENMPAPEAKFISRTPGEGLLGMALLGALVDADGSIQIGAGVTGAIHLATGQYEVDFNRDVTHCFFSANSYYTLTVVDLEPKGGNPDGVYLAEIDGAGTPGDDPFYLTVFCPQ